MPKLKLCYSMRELARAIGIDSLLKHESAENIPETDKESAAAKRLKRILNDGGVFPRNGKIWIADIRLNMPHFLDSWEELIHFTKIKRIRERGGRVSGDGDEDEDHDRFFDR